MLFGQVDVVVVSIAAKVKRHRFLLLVMGHVVLLHVMPAPVSPSFHTPRLVHGIILIRNVLSDVSDIQILFLLMLIWGE